MYVNIRSSYLQLIKYFESVKATSILGGYKMRFYYYYIRRYESTKKHCPSSQDLHYGYGYNRLRLSDWHA